jgi:hypothetical protein
MTNKILTGENWQGRVRSMLGVDAAFLPDTDLEMPDIVQVAEANIIDLVPDYETIPEDKKVYLESATVCECAVLACDSMPARLPVKESGPHVSFELEIDWEKKKIEFAEKRDMHISKLVKTPDVTYFAIS